MENVEKNSQYERKWFDKRNVFKALFVPAIKENKKNLIENRRKIEFSLK